MSGDVIPVPGTRNSMEQLSVAEEKLAKVIDYRCEDNMMVMISASKSSIRRFVITEKAPTRAFSWLKEDTMLNRR